MIADKQQRLRIQRVEFVVGSRRRLSDLEAARKSLERPRQLLNLFLGRLGHDRQQIILDDGEPASVANVFVRTSEALEEWCCQTGLNCRPLHYQWSALPLSYGSMPRIRESARRAPTRRPILATRPPFAQARETPEKRRKRPFRALPRPSAINLG